jgi:hypothetical protein
METILWLSVVTAAISFTVTETKLFRPVRDWLKGKYMFWGDLISCGYCLGFWVAFGLEAIYQPRLFRICGLLDYFLTAVVIAWLAGYQWVLMCWLFKKAGK